MRRRVRPGRLTTIVARTLAIAGAAIVLTCGSLLMLAGGATPAVAGCGDQVTYQAGMAAGGCPRRAVGVAVGVAAGLALGIGLAVLARAIQRSAASVGDLAAVDEALAAAEMEPAGPTASAGVPETANPVDEMAQQLDLGRELGEMADENELVEDSLDAAEVAEPVVKITVEYVKPEEPEQSEAAPAPFQGQVSFNSFRPEIPIYTHAEPDFINPIRDITVIAAAFRVGVRRARWKKEMREKGG
jgi:hypothetical protein